MTRDEPPEFPQGKIYVGNDVREVELLSTHKLPAMFRAGQLWIGKLQWLGGFAHCFGVEGGMATSWHTTFGKTVYYTPIPRGSRVTTCTLSQTDGDEDSDYVTYNGLSLGVMEPNNLYVTIHPFTRERQYLYCTATAKRKNEDDPNKFSNFLPVTVDFEKKSIELDEGEPRHGMSGLPNFLELRLRYTGILRNRLC